MPHTKPHALTKVRIQLGCILGNDKENRTKVQW